MDIVFGDFDLSDFWEKSEYANKEYVGETLTDELVKSVEDHLGYKLPQAYIELMKQQNGGIPKKINHRSTTPLSWAEDYITITGIFGINSTKSYSLGGRFGSQFCIDELGYPPIGVYFCDTPSAGHDMVCLDYRKNGSQGEPQVVFVDQEAGYQITFLAENFEAFIRGLEGVE